MRGESKVIREHDAEFRRVVRARDPNQRHRILRFTAFFSAKAWSSQDIVLAIELPAAVTNQGNHFKVLQLRYRKMTNGATQPLSR